MLKRLVVALILLGTSCTAAELELVSRVQVVSGDYRFGGLSGLEILDQGRVAFALSDRGNVFRMDLIRKGETLVGPRQTAAHYAWVGGDSEGLVISPDNEWFISTEQLAQVHMAWFRCYPVHPDFVDLVRNRGLEALAQGPDGALYVLPERVVRGAFPIYRLNSESWDIVDTLEPYERFAPVGADFGPEGRLWVLERAFTVWGFRTRIRVWTPEKTEVLLLTDYAEYDNLEGISVWQDRDGLTRITLVSDDNFALFLRGEMVEFILRD